MLSFEINLQQRTLDVLCFEMEAAELMDHFPCLVIRGKGIQQWQLRRSQKASYIEWFPSKNIRDILSSAHDDKKELGNGC